MFIVWSILPVFTAKKNKLVHCFEVIKFHFGDFLDKNFKCLLFRKSMPKNDFFNINCVKVCIFATKTQHLIQKMV